MDELKEQPPCPRCIVLEARIAALEQIVAEQTKQIAEQTKQIAALRERLSQNSSNSSKPPSSDAPGFKPAPPRQPSGKKRGGQKGHQRVVRPLVSEEKVAAVIDHFPERCQHCDSPLSSKGSADPNPVRHQVAEIPPIEPTVTEHRLHQVHCKHCGNGTRAALPKEVPRGHFGPRLTAVLALLSGGYRISKRGVKQLAGDLFGLAISTGMVCKLQRRAAEALEKPVQELADHVQTQNNHVDETSWRQEGKKAWLWVVVAPMVTLFRIARRRTAAIAQELLGDNYENVAICDRYRAYLWIGKVQLCWAHLRRDFQAMKDRGGTSQPIGEALLDISDALFEWWHRVRAGTLARSTFRTYVSTLRAECRAAISWPTNPSFGPSCEPRESSRPTTPPSAPCGTRFSGARAAMARTARQAAASSNGSSPSQPPAANKDATSSKPSPPASSAIKATSPPHPFSHDHPAPPEAVNGYIEGEDVDVTAEPALTFQRDYCGWHERASRLATRKRLESKDCGDPDEGEFAENLRVGGSVSCGYSS